MSYAKVLGATNRQDGYLEGNGYLVSWCVGHLVELAPPNIYDAKYVKWSMEMISSFVILINESFSLVQSCQSMPVAQVYHPLPLRQKH